VRSSLKERSRSRNINRRKAARAPAGGNRVILTDNETKVDLLNNEAIAKTIIALLREKPERPVTIGVHGDWGAGKSSILEMIESGSRTRTASSV
jgi:putative protein kinase ArgK-like GTPase of G3E family